MTDKCEPPKELRGEDGWHWVQLPGYKPDMWFWRCVEQDWRDFGPAVAVDLAATDGYRYLAPVATPAEVDALRAERDEVLKFQGEAHRLRTGNKLLADTVRSWGWEIRRQESNGELVGRALHEMHDAMTALDASRADLRARVARLEAVAAAARDWAAIDGECHLGVAMERCSVLEDAIKALEP